MKKFFKIMFFVYFINYNFSIFSFDFLKSYMSVKKKEEPIENKINIINRWNDIGFFEKTSIIIKSIAFSLAITPIKRMPLKRISIFGLVSLFLYKESNQFLYPDFEQKEIRAKEEIIRAQKKTIESLDAQLKEKK